MKRNRSIDAVRAIACAMVLFVHCPFPEPAGTLVAAQARFAVPFFLMVSGFFACREDARSTLSHAIRRLKDTAMLTLAGTIFYAVCNSLRDAMLGKSPLSWLSGLLSPIAAFRFLVFNRAVFLSSVMYYLFALLYVYALFILLIKTNLIARSKWIIAPLLAACVLLDEFLSLPWYYSGNFLLTGLPFFLLGYCFASKPPRIAHPERLLLPGILLVLGETLLFGEAYCYIGTLLVSISLFLSCLKRPDTALPQGLADFGKNCSVYVFIIHCAVRDFLQLLLPGVPAALFPLAVLCISALLSMLCQIILNQAKKVRLTP